jgi:O-antigen/teichoic acid export membrane protein
MSLLKKLAGQTALYGLSSMVGRMLNFLLVPFYTSVLAVNEFGVFTYFYSFVAFLNVVYLFGMETTYFRFANKDPLNELEIYQSTQTFVISLSLFISGSLVLLAQPISVILNYPDNSSYIVWLALIMGIDAITAIPFARLRQESKAGYFAFTKLTNIGLNIGLNLFFLVFCKGIYEGNYLPEFLPFIKTIYDPSRDIEYIFISNMIANLFMVPLLWKHFWVYRFRWNFEQFKPLLLYSYPLMFMGLAGMVNEVFDRILLKDLLPLGFYPGLSNDEALGIYGGCYKLSMFMTLAIQSFRYAADPFFFSKTADKNAPEVFARVMNWFIVACSFMFLVISLYSELIGELLLRKEVYKTGLTVVPVLLLANLFLGIYYNLSVWYKLTDRTYWGTWISIGGALFTIAGNIVLIPIMGYMGSAYTTLACYLLMMVVSYIAGDKYFHVPYDLLSIIIMIGTAVLFVIAGKFINTGNFWLDQFMYLLPVVVFAGIVLFLKNRRFGKKIL